MAKNKQGKSTPANNDTVITAPLPATDVTAPLVDVPVEDTGKAPDLDNPDSIKPATETISEEVKENAEDAGSVDTETISDEEKENAVDAEWVADKIAPYLDAYPEETGFHITSDGQVFLNADEIFAKEHQRFLKDGKEVLSFTIQPAE